ncbi:MAG: hypothetical protein IT374_18825 [Polyangiaceae bacterium]|nr:hypothetical protein [Polyangiaceae bacterium]
MLRGGADATVTLDLWAITCHFNPAGYRRRPRNYELFRARLARQGVQVVTVECTFGDEPPTLPPAPDVSHVRARDVLWQKERLLNLALRAVPRWVPKVAWLDADVLLEDGWAEETSALLERAPVAQPFARAVRLPPGAEEDDGSSTERYASFCHEVARDPGLLHQGSYDPHGHTGFAWAARRELLDACGLYEGCVAGSADHVMAHAFAGGLDSACVARIFGGNSAHEGHFRAWAARVAAAAGGRGVACGSGTLLHLWHGALRHRSYLERNRELAALRFDPARDLVDTAGAPLAFSLARPELRAWASEYFRRRREDDPP